MVFTVPQSRRVDTLALLCPTRFTDAIMQLSLVGLFASSSPAPCPGMGPCNPSSSNPLWLARLGSPGKPRQPQQARSRSSVSSFGFGFPVRHDAGERVGPASCFPSCLLGSRGAGSSALPARPSCSHSSSGNGWGWVPSPLGGWWSAAGRRLPSHPVVAEV